MDCEFSCFVVLLPGRQPLTDQACTRCKSRKTKCDGQVPQYRHCAERNAACEYARVRQYCGRGRYDLGLLPCARSVPAVALAAPLTPRQEEQRGHWPVAKDCVSRMRTTAWRAMHAARQHPCRRRPRCRPGRPPNPASFDPSLHPSAISPPWCLRISYGACAVGSGCRHLTTDTSANATDAT